MTITHDVAVLGVGGMGSAAAWQLARRGLSVVAVEQHDIAHDRGSSHGLSRIIRLAYFEHPSYVPLLRRAFELWGELEQASGEKLLHVTGGIDAGMPGSRVLEGSMESCRVHGLPHEVLSAGEVNRRFPGYRLPAGFSAVLQPDAGFLEPEKCIRAAASLASGLGAQVITGSRVHGWARNGDGISLHLEGAEIRARQLVVTAGAWMPKLVPSLAHLLRPERQVVAWFSVSTEAAFAPERFPVFVMQTRGRLLLWIPATRRAWLQDRQVPPSGRAGRSRRHEPARRCRR